MSLFTLCLHQPISNLEARIEQHPRFAWSECRCFGNWLYQAFPRRAARISGGASRGNGTKRNGMKRKKNERTNFCVTRDLDKDVRSLTYLYLGERPKIDQYFSAFTGSVVSYERIAISNTALLPMQQNTQRTYPRQGCCYSHLFMPIETLRRMKHRKGYWQHVYSRP